MIYGAIYFALEVRCMDRKYCVYRHTNKANGKVYIGITGDIPEHRWANGLRYQGNVYFNNAINKYGWDGFEHEILHEGLSQEEASRLEVELIAEHQSFDRRFGYNIALGGVGHASISEETRQKMRESHLGEKNHNFGKPKTDDVKEKLSISNKKYKKEHPPKTGWHHTEETRAKMRAKWYKRFNPWEGKKRPREVVAKIAEANSKAVLCIETGVVYPNARIAAEVVGTQYSSISAVCNNRNSRVLAGGFSWRFATAEDLVNGSPQTNVAPKNPSYYKAVQCVETNDVFCSIADAARAVNRSKNTVCDACKNPNKTAGGYHWRYVEVDNTVELAEHKTTVIADSNPSNYKAVRCVETGDVFPSMAEAARWANTSRQEVRRACEKNTKTSGGYHWEYAKTVD